MTIPPQHTWVAVSYGSSPQQAFPAPSTGKPWQHDQPGPIGIPEQQHVPSQQPVVAPQIVSVQHFWVPALPTLSPQQNWVAVS